MAAAGYNPNNDTEAPQGPDDGISSLAWSPTSNLLCASSWDSTVRIWDVQAYSDGQGNTRVQQVAPKAAVRHDAPVLCTAWSGDGQRMFSGGCDNVAKMYDLGSGAHTVVARHDAPVRSVAYSDPLNMVITGSWDKTLRFWDGRQQNAALTVQLGDRCFAMSFVHPLLIVATANRQLVVYNMADPSREFKRIPSMLKYQTRSLCAFPDTSGFAYGSIEGRVSITYLQQNRESETFAFKCHRTSEAREVYAVNGISFNKRFGTFATVGGDGSYCFWDKDSKTRLSQSSRGNLPITDCKFNEQGNLFAYAASYDWSKGHQNYDPLRQKNHILIRGVPEKDIKPKDKNKGRR